MNATHLPELTDDRVAGIESAVFARIADDRRRGRRRRTRIWSGVGAAAAIVIVAAVIAPTVTASLLRGASSTEAIAPATDGGGGPLSEAARSDGPQAFDSALGSEAVAPGEREIISTGSAVVVVADVRDAANTVAEDAQARGGYVESLTVGSSDQVRAGRTGDMVIGPVPSPGDGWVSVRIPADELEDAMGALGALGEVTSSSVSRQDVSDQAIDIRARIAAGEASVARLTELLGQATSVADLIAAESALAERQATLDADRQQLEWLEGQVALSTLTVQLQPEREAVSADPAGFGDGVVAGWNGLVATLNGIVIAIGFLLPWLAVLGVAALLVWGVVRLVRRSRRAGPQGEAPAEEDQAT